MAKTKYQSGESRLLWRSELKEHPLNPRTLSASAKKKLRNSVKEIGVMDMPVFNEVTGRIVGGHQRIHTIDFLEKYTEGKNDYQIEVAVVTLTEEDEAKALARLNNQNLQGSWDAELLKELSELATFEDMGFEALDIDYIMADLEMDIPVYGELETTKGNIESIKEENRKSGTESALDRFEGLKDGKEDLIVDYYVMVVCKDAAEKEKLMRSLGIPKGEKYISPAEILARIDK